MNLIQKIRDYFFKKREEVVEQSSIIHPPHDEEEERRAIIAQKQEDNKWFIKIVQKATERYIKIHPTKNSIPIEECTSCDGTYTIYHERSAMYKDGIEAAVERELQWMLKRASKVPKGTVPSV